MKIAQKRLPDSSGMKSIFNKKELPISLFRFYPQFKLYIFFQHNQKSSLPFLMKLILMQFSTKKTTAHNIHHAVMPVTHNNRCSTQHSA
jgi:hypothetical protein